MAELSNQLLPRTARQYGTHYFSLVRFRHPMLQQLHDLYDDPNAPMSPDNQDPNSPAPDTVLLNDVPSAPETPVPESKSIPLSVFSSSAVDESGNGELIETAKQPSTRFLDKDFVPLLHEEGHAEPEQPHDHPDHEDHHTSAELISLAPVTASTSDEAQVPSLEKTGSVKDLSGAFYQTSSTTTKPPTEAILERRASVHISPSGAVFSTLITALLTVSYCVGCFMNGFIMGSHSTLLPNLAARASSTVATVSYLFSVRSGGMFLGALLAGKIFDHPRVNGQGNKLLMIFCMIWGVAEFLFPVVNAFYAQCILIFLMGVLSNLINTGRTCMLIWLHGHNVAPYMFLYWSASTLGSFVSPLMVQGLLNKPFPRDSSDNLGILEDQLKYSQWLLGLLCFILGVSWMLLPSPSKPKDIRVKNTAETEKKEAETPTVAASTVGGEAHLVRMPTLQQALALKQLAQMQHRSNHPKARVRHRHIHIINAIHYFLHLSDPLRLSAEKEFMYAAGGLFCLFAASQDLYGSYVNTYAKSYLKMEPATANYLTSVFYGAFVLGRWAIAPFAFKVSPSKLLTVNYVSAAIVVCAYLPFRNDELAVWIVTAAFGLAFSTTYPSMNNFLEHYILITAKVQSIFLVGGAIGSIVFPFIISVMLSAGEKNIQWLPFIVAGALVISLSVFIFEKTLGDRRLRKDAVATDKTDADLNEPEKNLMRVLSMAREADDKDDGAPPPDNFRAYSESIAAADEKKEAMPPSAHSTFHSAAPIHSNTFQHHQDSNSHGSHAAVHHAMTVGAFPSHESESAEETAFHRMTSLQAHRVATMPTGVPHNLQMAEEAYKRLHAQERAEAGDGDDPLEEEDSEENDDNENENENENEINGDV